MASKQNCWEAKNCRRQPGGANANKFGVCPAAKGTTCDGRNGGKNGGRICWAITGTLCGGKIQGTFAQKSLSCLECDFFQAVKAEEGSQFVLLGCGQPIEEVLREGEERYRIMFEEVPVGLYRSTADERLLAVNGAFVQMLGYPDRDALLAVDAGRLYVDLEDRVRWIALMERDGSVHGCEARFYKSDGDVIWVRRSAHAVRDGQGRVLYYEGSVEDITERRQMEAKLKNSFERLQRTFEETIRAMALTVEMRDPYTAGHQRRVADLACAIAEELGLSPEQIDAVRLSATIHDIGKITVPAEILSRPGRLNWMEIKLVQAHPQTAYDILKAIDFPWPIAQIVLQHHERLDGSGYPFGLRGEDILLEARILGVADVVEAMASHRPYRPALGVDQALEEIGQKRGIFFDAQVVDACFRIFVEKGFDFERGHALAVPLSPSV